MGQETHQDLGLSITVLIELLKLLEHQWADREDQWETLAFIGDFCTIAYAGSFCGNKVFHTNLHGFVKHHSLELVEGGKWYIMIPLLGRFKNEDGKCYHLAPLAFESALGIKTGLWVDWLVSMKKLHLQLQGPEFSDHQGQRLKPSWVGMEILDRLHSVQSEQPEVIPKEVNVYGISRSFRRGATTQARNQKVAENDINLINRWRQVEEAQGHRPKLRMQDHYSIIQRYARGSQIYSGFLQHCEENGGTSWVSLDNRLAPA
jgi:hypothetical protein